MNSRGNVPPRSWADPSVHLLELLTHPWYGLVFDISAKVIEAVFGFFKDLHYAPAAVPVTTGSISSPVGLGSNSLPVPIELFGMQTFLADSMQFHLEAVLRHARTGVYYVMPTFRGDSPDDTHVSQFVHVEAERRGSLELTLSVVEKLVARIAAELLQSGLVSRIDEAAGSVAHIESLATRTPVRVRYSEVLGLVADVRSATELIGDEPCLTRQGERLVLERLNASAAWITHPPASIVPFYQACDSSGRALCGDLIMSIGEVVGAGQRHSTDKACYEALLKHHVDPQPYDWYLEMKREHPLETSGFGMGLERLVAVILRHNDIRDLQLFPRLRTIPYPY